MLRDVVIGALHHSWNPFVRTRSAVEALGRPFVIVDSSPTDPPIPRSHEIWIRKPCDRYYPLFLLKALLHGVADMGAPLLVIEADILLNAAVLNEIARLGRDCYFLYDETDPTDPEAYERKRTMSMLLQPQTVRHVDAVLSSVADETLRSVIHCEPSFMRSLLGLQPCTSIRLCHQTHSSREVALLGIAQKTNSSAGEDPERSAQRQLMIRLAQQLRPQLDALRLVGRLSEFHNQGVCDVAIFGATSTALSLGEQIADTLQIVAVIDDQRSKKSTQFCGKPLYSVSRFLESRGTSPETGVIVTAEPEEEHQLLSRCGPFHRRGLPVCSLRSPVPLRGTSNEDADILRLEALRHDNGYFVRLNAVLMAKSGIDLGTVAKIIGYPETTIERWVWLYERYGTAALNYWVIS